jgi:hypothetical protein
MDAVFISTALIVFSLLVIGGIFLSHRVAGPLYRLQIFLHQMAESKNQHLKELHFRKSDFFPELADAYNLVVKKEKEKQRD